VWHHSCIEHAIAIAGVAGSFDNGWFVGMGWCHSGSNCEVMYSGRSVGSGWMECGAQSWIGSLYAPCSKCRLHLLPNWTELKGAV